MLPLSNNGLRLLAISQPVSLPVRLPFSACRAKYFSWPPALLGLTLVSYISHNHHSALSLNKVLGTAIPWLISVYIYLSIYRHFGTIFGRVNICTLSRTLTFHTLGHSHMKCYTLLFTYSQKRVVLCYT